MLDGIVSCSPGKSIVAVKNVVADEPHFAGHFPGHPIMPGVLIVEAMAQAGGVLIWESIAPEERNFILYLVGVEKGSLQASRAAGGSDTVDCRDSLPAERTSGGLTQKRRLTGVVATAEILQAPG